MWLQWWLQICNVGRWCPHLMPLFWSRFSLDFSIHIIAFFYISCVCIHIWRCTKQKSNPRTFWMPLLHDLLLTRCQWLLSSFLVSHELTKVNVFLSAELPILIQHATHRYQVRACPWTYRVSFFLLTYGCFGMQVTVMAKVYWGDPKVKICGAVVDCRLDSLVMGSRGFGPVKRYALVYFQYCAVIDGSVIICEKDSICWFLEIHSELPFERSAHGSFNSKTPAF